MKVLRAKDFSVRTLSTIFLVCLITIVYFTPKTLLFDTTRPTLCICKRFFGFDCLGCGLTRALYSFLHGDFKNAFELNLAIILIVPICFIEILITINSSCVKLLAIRKLLFLLLPFLLFINYIVKYNPF
jgi:hypothetical protein